MKVQDLPIFVSAQGFRRSIAAIDISLDLQIQFLQLGSRRVRLKSGGNCISPPFNDGSCQLDNSSSLILMIAHSAYIFRICVNHVDLIGG
jgi:hypothetical protein